MARPNTRNGFTAIANELMDALSRITIPGEQMRCLFFALRHTYGFRRNSCEFRLNVIARKTGMLRQNVRRALDALRARNMVRLETVTRNSRQHIRIQFNKDYETWSPAPSACRSALPLRLDAPSGSPDDSAPLASLDQCRTLFDLRKDSLAFAWEHLAMAFGLLKNRRSRTPRAIPASWLKFSSLAQSAAALHALEQQGHDPQQTVLPVLDWAASHAFWSRYHLPLASLTRISKRNGLAKFQNMLNDYAKAAPTATPDAADILKRRSLEFHESLARAREQSTPMPDYLKQARPPATSAPQGPHNGGTPWEPAQDSKTPGCSCSAWRKPGPAPLPSHRPAAGPGSSAPNAWPATRPAPPASPGRG